MFSREQLASKCLQLCKSEDLRSTMSTFYLESDYQPYALEGFNYSLVTSVAQPGRISNQVIIEVSECLIEREGCEGSNKARILFNFTGAHQISVPRLIHSVLLHDILASFLGRGTFLAFWASSASSLI